MIFYVLQVILPVEQTWVQLNLKMHLYLSEVPAFPYVQVPKVNALYNYFDSFYVTAPNFIPSDLSLVSTSSTSITVKWSVPSTPPDADGYVIYYASGSGPGMSVKVMGDSVNQHAIEDLTPNTSYTISIRAYQDILGPASETIVVMTTNVSEGM